MFFQDRDLFGQILISSIATLQLLPWPVCLSVCLSTVVVVYVVDVAEACAFERRERHLLDVGRILKVGAIFR